MGGCSRYARRLGPRDRRWLCVCGEDSPSFAHLMWGCNTMTSCVATCARHRISRKRDSSRSTLRRARGNGDGGRSQTASPCKMSLRVGMSCVLRLCCRAPQPSWTAIGVGRTSRSAEVLTRSAEPRASYTHAPNLVRHLVQRLLPDPHPGWSASNALKIRTSAEHARHSRLHA